MTAIRYSLLDLSPIAEGGTAAEAQPVDLQSDKMQDTAHTRAYLESTRF